MPAAPSTPAVPASAPSRSPERPVVRRYVAGVLAATCVVTVLALGDTEAIAAAPLAFVALVAAMLVLDGVRIDLFGRGRISPASAATLALACLFGPLGPIVGEAAIAVVRAGRREPVLRFSFDFGALALAGAAAAGTFALLPTGSPVELLLAGPVAGLVYYVVNVTLLATAMGLAEGVHPLTAWRERLAWLWPHFLLYGFVGAALVAAEERLGVVAIAVFAVPFVALWVAQKQYVDRSRSSVEELRRSYDELQQAHARLERVLEERRVLMERMQQSYLSTITSLARTIEAKDPYTGGHTERVARVTAMLARELGVAGEEIAALEVGAVIHDIGKIGVPDAILLKPGRLSEDEFAEMRRHPEISSYIVAELDVPVAVRQMVRSHHERYDGRGYPDGLAGTDIPLPARILTVADTLDAMTSDRPYRPALPLERAVDEIRSLAGEQFCPDVVAALERLLERDATLGGEYAASTTTA